MNMQHYKIIFFHGYIITFAILLTASCLFDMYIENYIDATVEIITLGLLILVYHLWRKNNQYIYAIILAWLGAVFGYLIVIIYDFSMDTQFFLLFMPFAFFYLLDKHLLIKHLTLNLLITLAIMLWGYMYSENRLFFDNPINLTIWIALFIFVLAIGMFNYLALSRSFTYLEDSNIQKDILLQEVHHRVKNNLNMMSSMIGLQETHNNPQMEQFVDDYRQRINAIALIHELLYTNNDDYREIDFSEYIKKLSRNLISSCAHPETELNIHSDNILFSLQQMTNLGLILQELISNSLKYAHAGNAIIDISLHSTEEGFILKYKDNGTINNKSITQDDNLGLTLVKLKVKELKGKLDIEISSKKLFTLTLEKEKNVTQKYYTYIYTIRFPNENL
jgi:two-component sensor histidine kinase